MLAQQRARRNPRTKRGPGVVEPGQRARGAGPQNWAIDPRPGLCPSTEPSNHLGVWIFIFPETSVKGRGHDRSAD
jgi:hypothetical protein